MDFIEGVTLEEAWSKLSWFTTIRLAFQLHGLIRQLRSVTSHCAGLLSADNASHSGLTIVIAYLIDGPSNIASFFRFWVDFVSIRKAKATLPLLRYHLKPGPNDCRDTGSHSSWPCSSEHPTRSPQPDFGILLGFIQNSPSTHQCISSICQKAGIGSHGNGGGCFHGFQLGTMRKKNTC
jgi:hypothetical protein